MKTKFTMLLSCIASLSVHAQSPTTLNYKNYLFPTSSAATYHYTEGDIPTPAPGENQTYDYGHQPDVNAFDYSDSFFAPHNPNFPSARTAITYGGGILSSYTLYLSDDNNGAKLLGQESPAFRNSLESITGTATDSLIENEQSLS